MYKYNYTLTALGVRSRYFSTGLIIDMFGYRWNTTVQHKVADRPSQRHLQLTKSEAPPVALPRQRVTPT